jgi:hypothetical protein
MSASPEELIAINGLLIEREGEFARVHTLESQINALLGDSYPFDPPVTTVPSTIKKKVVKPKKAVSKTKPFKARRLNHSEVAYRMTWHDSGQETERTATDLRGLDTLIQESLPGMKLLKIETVDLSGNSVEKIFPV